MWYWHKDRHIGQCNNIESQKINLHMWSDDFQQGWQNHSMGKDSHFSKWCWEKLDIDMEKNEVGHLLYHLQK